jgi:hypothetical protein
VKIIKILIIWGIFPTQHHIIPTRKAGGDNINDFRKFCRNTYIWNFILIPPNPYPAYLSITSFSRQLAFNLLIKHQNIKNCGKPKSQDPAIAKIRYWVHIIAAGSFPL